MRTLISGLDHPEAVAWDPTGRLICGGERGEIYAVELDANEPRIVASTGGFVLGVALDGDGRVYACDSALGKVLRIDLDGGAIKSYVADDLTCPNFAVFDAMGNLWLSDSGSWKADDGRVLVVEPGGAVRVASTAVPGFTNGLALSPDGAWLYVVESSTSRVSRLPVHGTTLGPPELVVSLDRAVPDGLAFTEDGTLIVSCYRPDAIYAIEDGAARVLAEDWQGIALTAPTNIAFFGDGLDRLVAANLHAGHLTELDSPGRGAPLHRPVDLP
jgi:sugar lactone lactonase YvrE